MAVGMDTEMEEEEEEVVMGGKEEEEEAFEGEEDGLGFPVAGVEDFGMGDGSFSAKQRKMKKKAKSGGFESLGLSPAVYRAVKRKGYQVPTPIQRKALPIIIAGHDVVAMARTGSGKTAAFLIPLIERLKCHSPVSGARAVILSPTRELAMQTFKFTKELGRFTNLRAALLVGGDSMDEQFEALSNCPDIIIATPGRLMHHLSEVEEMSLHSVEYVVFDEADRLFEMGFADQLRDILRRMPDGRQTLLFSATMPRMLAEFARAGLKNPELIRLDTESKISSDLQVAFFSVRHEEKAAALLHLLRDVIKPKQQTIIFVATKHHVDFLNELFIQEGIAASVVYGAMDQTARKINTARFRSRKTMYLLVTDVAARGIDIPLLDNVVNYDFPSKPKLFVHRVGRAARAGRSGTAYSFLTNDEVPYLLDLHLYLSRPIRPAPQIGDGQASAEQDGITVFGRFPQSVIDLAMEHIRELMSTHFDLVSYEKVCKKAFRLYLKTRPPASSESVTRAKVLAREGLHPLFRNKAGDSEAMIAAFTRHLKSFRPQQTVLEAEAAAAKAKGKQGGIADAVDIMRKKREVHERVIAASHEKAKERARALLLESQETDASEEESGSDDEDGGNLTENEIDEEMDRKEDKVEKREDKKRKRSGSSQEEKKKSKARKSFRDEENFIGLSHQNQFAERELTISGKTGGESFCNPSMDAAVLDILPDEAGGAAKKRATYHWDKRKKKYLRLLPGEKMTATGKIKTESGVKVNKGQSGLYRKWQQRTKMRIPAVGMENEDERASSSGSRPAIGQAERGGPPGGRGRGRGRFSGSFGGGGRGMHEESGTPRKPKDELRSADEIRKERQKKITRQRLTGKGRGRGGSRSDGGIGQGWGGRGGSSRSDGGFGRGRTGGRGGVRGTVGDRGGRGGRSRSDGGFGRGRTGGRGGFRGKVGDRGGRGGSSRSDGGFGRGRTGGRGGVKRTVGGRGGAMSKFGKPKMKGAGRGQKGGLKGGKKMRI